MKQTKEIIRCKTCIMDETDPDIIFTSSGCNHCDNYFERIKNEIPQKNNIEKSLNKIVNRIKSSKPKAKYNCLIGVSGGVDSTAVAYYSKELGLKPLAVHLDNGWNSELAVNNIRKTLNKLDIDLHTHIINWEEFKSLQKSFLYSSVPNCEIPTDHAINALMVKTAIKHGIKFILHGGNIQTEGIMPFKWGYYNQDLRHLKCIHKKFLNTSLKTYPKLSLFTYFYAMIVKKVKFIPILNYLSYNKSKAKSLISNELDWIDYGGKHFESIFTRFFQGYYLPKKFGFDKRKAHLSCLICAGEITRSRAIEALQEPAYELELQNRDILYIKKKLSLSEEEFELIMNDEPKDHFHFASNKFVFHDMIKLKKIFKKYVTNV